NGERGEECDSIPRGGEQDRRPLLQLRNKLISKTCQWHVFDALYLYLCTKAVASLLLGNPSLAGISSFVACRHKIHLFGALLRRRCGAK
ncbi:MAG: hypothetical protein J6A05_05860, partial [Oscillospiraceae bacterium]|nr:hypothetical protein [Oscillospiraceae bacterium]